MVVLSSYQDEQAAMQGGNHYMLCYWNWSIVLFPYRHSSKLKDMRVSGFQKNGDSWFLKLEILHSSRKDTTFWTLGQSSKYKVKLPDIILTRCALRLAKLRAPIWREAIKIPDLKRLIPREVFASRADSWFSKRCLRGASVFILRKFFCQWPKEWGASSLPYFQELCFRFGSIIIIPKFHMSLAMTCQWIDI